MNRSLKTKTSFEEDALKLAEFVEKHFKLLKIEKAQLNFSRTAYKKIQNYLDEQSDRVSKNVLRGIIGVHDVWRNHTGGRIHLIVGLEGPIVEAISASVVSEPIDYETKSRYLTRVLENVSGSIAPKVGNIHLHLLHCDGNKVSPITLLDFIRKEHGMQNDIQQLSDCKMYEFVNTARLPYWRPNVDRTMIQNLFG